MFHVPEDWVEHDVIVSYKMVITDPKGNQGMFNAAGKLVKVFDDSFVLRVYQGDLLVPKDNVHHMVKISSIAVAKGMPGPNMQA